MQNHNLPPEFQQMQSEMHNRIEAEHQKKRHKSALNTLYLVGLFALVLAGLVGYAKCEAEQRNEKHQTEINHNSINQ